jgi:acetyltransferase-like isoleucine patch superfamily enzyme
MWHQQDRLLFLLAEFESISVRAGRKTFWRPRQLNHRGVKHGREFYIGRGFWLHSGRNFSFGERCSLGENAHILDHGPIILGDDFIAATGLQINSGSHDMITMESQAHTIIVGNRVWCGASVTIIPGAAIGDDAVIAAGSLVRTSIPSGWLAAGVPAKAIRPIDRNSHPFPKWGG